MRWRELQGAKAIDVEQEDVNMYDKSWHIDHTALCGPLVEKQRDESVTLVHSTAAEYVALSDLVLLMRVD